MRSHDPERWAALLLAGDLTSADEERFERHLLECEPCWREARLGDLGRRVAERGRDIAPPHLRDRIRAAVELAPVPRRHLSSRPLALLAVLVVTLATFAVPAMLGGRRQPEAIRLLLADFDGADTLPRAAPPDLPARLGDLRLASSSAGSVRGLALTAHRYRDRAGHRVVVYRGDGAFPQAVGAEPHPGASTWEARVGSVTLFCATRPFHALVMGDDAGDVRLAVTRLRLR